MIRIALYQPDIPQNTGTILRLGACLGVPVDIIEPCGFILDDRKLKRAGMDYINQADYERHISFEKFLETLDGRRLVLLSTKASESYLDFSFRPDDVLLFGRESAGVPDSVAEKASLRLKIPMKEGSRSLNLALSAGIVAAEALRQTKLFP